MHLNAPQQNQFTHDGLTLSYIDTGPGRGAGHRPVMMVHGFASSAYVNWVQPGWQHSLEGHGRRIIAIDNRGHGQSDKPHDPAAYHPLLMAGDVVALMDHLGIDRFDLFGYSMGARISSFLALHHPERVGALVLGGLGIGLVNGVGDWDPIADALLAPSLDVVTHQRGRMFRAFADKTGSDRVALAACIASNRVLLNEAEVGRILAPTLIGIGTRDDIAGDGQALADLMPDARAIAIPDRDHMLAVGDRVFKAAVLAFLDEMADR